MGCDTDDRDSRGSGYQYMRIVWKSVEGILIISFCCLISSLVDILATNIWQELASLDSPQLKKLAEGIQNFVLGSKAPSTPKRIWQLFITESHRPLPTAFLFSQWTSPSLPCTYRMLQTLPNPSRQWKRQSVLLHGLIRWQVYLHQQSPPSFSQCCRARKGSLLSRWSKSSL